MIFEDDGETGQGTGSRRENDSDGDDNETIPMLCEFLALSSIPASPTYFHSIISINKIEKSKGKKIKVSGRIIG